VQYLTHPRSHLDWLFIAIATGVGAYLGSEMLLSTLGITAGGPEIDGLFIIPAVLTGLALGLLADAFVRYIALDPV